MSFAVLPLCAPNNQSIDTQPKIELLGCEDRLALITDLVLVLLLTTVVTLIVLKQYYGIDLKWANAIGTLGKLPACALAGVGGSIIVADFIRGIVSTAAHISHLTDFINKNATDTRVSELTEQFKKQKEELELKALTLTVEVAEKNEEISKLAAEKDTVESTLREKDEAHSEELARQQAEIVGKAKAALAEKDASIENLSKEKESLQEAKNRFESRALQATQEKEAGIRELSDLVEESMKKLEEAKSEKEALAGTVAHLEESIAAAGKEGGFAGRVAELEVEQKQWVSAKLLEEKIEKLKLDLEVKTEALEQLKVEMDALVKAKDKSGVEALEQKQQLEKTQMELDSKTLLLEDMLRQIDTAKEQLERVSKESQETLEKAHADAEGLTNTAQEKVKAAEMQVEKLNEAVINLQKEQKELTQAIEELKGKLAEHTLEEETLRVKVGEARGELEQVDEEYKLKEGELQALQEKLAAVARQTPASDVSFNATPPASPPQKREKQPEIDLFFPPVPGAPTATPDATTPPAALFPPGVKGVEVVDAGATQGAGTTKTPNKIVYVSDGEEEEHVSGDEGSESSQGSEGSEEFVHVGGNPQIDPSISIWNKANERNVELSSGPDMNNYAKTFEFMEAVAQSATPAGAILVQFSKVLNLNSVEFSDELLAELIEDLNKAQEAYHETLTATTSGINIEEESNKELLNAYFLSVCEFITGTVEAEERAERVKTGLFTVAYFIGMSMAPIAKRESREIPSIEFSHRQDAAEAPSSGEAGEAELDTKEVEEAELAALEEQKEARALKHAQVGKLANFTYSGKHFDMRKVDFSNIELDEAPKEEIKTGVVAGLMEGMGMSPKKPSTLKEIIEGVTKKTLPELQKAAQVVIDESVRLNASIDSDEEVDFSTFDKQTKTFRDTVLQKIATRLTAAGRIEKLAILFKEE